MVYFDNSTGNFLCYECNRYGTIMDTEFLTFVKLIAETPLAESDSIDFKELDMILMFKFLIDDIEKRIDKTILSAKNYLDFISTFR